MASSSKSGPPLMENLIFKLKKLSELTDSLDVNNENIKQELNKVQQDLNEIVKDFQQTESSNSPNVKITDQSTVENIKKNPESALTQSFNPVQGLYQVISENLFKSDTDLRPVHMLSMNEDYILETINNRMSVGEFLTDIYQLKIDNSFIVISNHIHPVQMSGFVTKFSTLNDIPNVVMNFLNPGYGLVNALAVREVENVCTRIFAGFDSGNIIMLDDNLSVFATKQFCHNIITKISVSPSHQQDRFCCSDYDGRIVVMDTEEFEPLLYYDNAHSDSINDLVYHPEQNELIISAGSDHDILLWDFRISQSNHPATLLTKVQTKPTALDWSTENVLTFGTESGNVVKFDVRNKKPLHRHMFFNNPMDQTERDCSIVQMRPLKMGKYLAILADNHHWIFDRSISKLLQHHQYSDDVRIQSCLSSETDFLTIGSRFHVSFYKNILL